MKSAHETATDLVTGLTDQRTQGPGTKQHSKEDEQQAQYHERLMEKFWGKMMGAYGIQWERSYGHVDGPAFEEWSAALRHVDPMSIKYGMEQLDDEDRNREAKYPPNLIKFLRLCRKPITHTSHKTWEEPKRLGHSDPGAKDRHFTAAKELLGDWKPPKAIKGER